MIYNFAAIFIVLSGISCAFSSNNLTRGLKLSVVALSITIVTYIYNSSYFILFGILHLLAFCILLYHFVLYKMKNNMLLLTGILIIIIGIILSGFNFPWNHLFFLGMTNLSFQSMDYFPIFPWAGFF